MNNPIPLWTSALLLAALAAAAWIVPVPFHIFGSVHAQRIGDLPGTDDPSRTAPRILVAGDSISLAYRFPLAKRLHGCGSVHAYREYLPQPLIQRLRAPRTRAVNWRDAEAARRRLASLPAGREYDLVIFNTGLHDALREPPEAAAITVRRYADALDSALSILSRHAAHILFVETTPVIGQPEPAHTRDMIDRLNAVAAVLAERHGSGFIGAPLGPAPDLELLLLADGIHLSVEGVQRMVYAIEGAVRETLGCAAAQPPRLP